uniref:Uncharacterized protein n=1 Tax=Oryza punctata TaxID=4537 RepID=A0A0E0JTY5_ORYPU
MSKEVAQLEDINAIGRMLKSISTLAKINVPHQAERDMLIDHLAMNLEFLTNTHQVGTIKDMILDHVFFWFKERRKRFFIYDILYHTLLPPYDGNNPIQNVKFVSGAYEEEVQVYLFTQI